MTDSRVPASFPCAVLVLALSYWTPGEAQEWISFNALYPGREHQATASSTEAIGLGPVTRTDIRGVIVRPQGQGPFPAVVLLHDCRGIKPYQNGWARKLAGWGYVALLVESFLSRNATNVCARLVDPTLDSELLDRVADARGALAYLARQPYVDPQRIGVMGWASRSILGSVTSRGSGPTAGHRFKAAVAFYPDCKATPGPFIAPSLVLIGDQDDWTPAHDCQALASHDDNAGDGVQLVVYPGVHHGFDDLDVKQPRSFSKIRFADRAPPQGVTLGYDTNAHHDAISRVVGFLGDHLQAGWAVGYEQTPSPHEYPDTAWAINPHQPGPSLPPVGRSLFDLLFTVADGDRRVYDIPFPFERLSERIRAQIHRTGYVGPPLKQVLIPVGRSLQRHAAAPDFFKFPRLVLAVDTESDVVGVGKSVQLKDRLFLGYQEKSNVIEVISYNEKAGRFEFQVVKGYSAGATPEVFYANRAICTSCHQNASPIFSLVPWDETNRSRSVALRLAEQRERFYGVPAFPGSVPAATVDTATDRANMFSAYQLLWRDGCADDDARTSTLCRANALKAMLQYRMSDGIHYDQQSASFEQHFLSVARRNWSERWANGLNIPNPDIPNREPVFAHPEIPAALDPLNFRPPLETWYAEGDIGKVITGLAKFLPEADIRKLDEFLFTRGLSSNVSRQEYSDDCAIEFRRLVSGVHRLRARCGDADDSPPTPIFMQASMMFRNQRLLQGRVDWLQLADGTRFTALTLYDGTIERNGDAWVLRARVSTRANGRHVRMPDGRAVEELTLRWDETAPAVKASSNAEPGTVPSGRVSMTIMDDFSPVDDAVDALARDQHITPAGLFSARPFQGVATIQALFKAVGIPPTDWCCQDEAGLPPARVDHAIGDLNTAGLMDVQGSAALRTFTTYCGTCHRTTNAFPPNFLAGTSDEIEQRILRCAPRIRYRLSMWDLDADARPRTPMPPMHMVEALGIGTEEWRNGPQLASLREYVGNLMASQDTGLDPLAFPDRDYIELPACLGVEVSSTQ